MIALHAAIRDDELVPRPSFWQLSPTRKALARGERIHLVCHEDVLVFPKPLPLRRRWLSRTPHDSLALSVWPVAQKTARAQRRGRYLPGLDRPPRQDAARARRHVIRAYSQPGELVLDPMCGIGTTLVEAIHLDRDATGVELEPRWASLAAANVALAREQGAPAHGTVITGDARRLRGLLDRAGGRSRWCSPHRPTAAACMARSAAAPAAGRGSWTTPTRATPATSAGKQAALPNALPRSWPAAGMLAPAGGSSSPPAHTATGRAVDLPGQLTQAAEAAGLMAYERNAALLVGLRGDQLVPRPSFFQLDRVRKARRRGLPLRIIAHEDVLVFRRPTEPRVQDEDAG